MENEESKGDRKSLVCTDPLVHDLLNVFGLDYKVCRSFTFHIDINSVATIEIETIPSREQVEEMITKLREYGPIMLEEEKP